MTQTFEVEIQEVEEMVAPMVLDLLYWIRRGEVIV